MGTFRLLLAVSVLAGHMQGRSIFGFRFLYADLAVECFYMISGFYMALVLHEKYNQPRDYWIFLQQRCLRLYPSYFIILAFFILVQGGHSLLAGSPSGFLIPWSQCGDILPGMTKAVFALLNLSLVGQDYTFYWAVNPQDGHVVFDVPHSGLLISVYQFLAVVPAWTLGVEISFYVLAPFLVRRSFAWQASFVAILILTRWILWAGFHVPTDPWLYRLFPLQLGFFLSGSLGYAIYKHHQEKLKAVLASCPWIPWIFMAAIVFYSRLPLAHQLYVIFLPIVFIMVPLLFTATKNHRLDRLIGELSFPFYLGHLLMMYIVNQITDNRLPRNFYGPCYLLLTLVFSYLFYRFIESRTEAFRSRLFVREHRGETAR